jgi:uncharacterized membrane protein
MNWRRVFRIRLYVRDSLWVLPLAGAALGALLGSVDIEVDKHAHLAMLWQYSSSTATTILATIAGATAALTGFVVTVTTLVVQMATGTFSARYMRLWYRDRMLKVALALLVGTLAFSLSLMRRVQNDFVPNLGVSLAGILVIISLLVFLVFLDRYLHRLRPVAVAALVTRYFKRNLALELERARDPAVFVGAYDPHGVEPSLVVRSHRSGAIQAIDADALARWATEHQCLLVLRHAMGDFVPAGATLVEGYGGTSGDEHSVRRIGKLVVLGSERTIEQDPAFAIRILVDIANRALSSSVNDPTTAVQVLDYLSESLRLVGTTELPKPDGAVDGRPRIGLMVPTRDWEHYLELSVTEIRLYGVTSIQVLRRLRAMLEELRGEVWPAYRPAVERELARLEATVTRAYGDTVDHELASVADIQGIGGPRARPSIIRSG